MKTAAKKITIITDADIDGPMMSGSGMTKAEAVKMAEWLKQRKAALKEKQQKGLLKKTL